MFAVLRSIAVASATAFLLCGCVTTPKFSDLQTNPVTSHIPVAYAPAATPPGYIGFCMRFADQCAAPANATKVLPLTPQNWDLLVQVNHTVNGAIWQESDERHYGRAEYWTIPTDGFGDCEDITLAKRKSLADAGLPQGALRIALVETPSREMHAVLTVATDKGDLVLDSLRQDIISWDKTGYDWIERQDPDVQGGWASLAPAGTQSPTITTAAIGQEREGR